MNAEAVRADRNDAIREAARTWKKAGAIDEASLKAIEAAYPDDRVRVGPVFRVLLFLFTLARGGRWVRLRAGPVQRLQLQ